MITDVLMILLIIFGILVCIIYIIGATFFLIDYLKERKE